MLKDKTIQCAEKDCPDTFIFTKNDQEFYAEHKFNDPKYCKYHRAVKKAERESRENQKNYPFNAALEATNKRPFNRYERSNDQDDFSGGSLGHHDR